MTKRILPFLALLPALATLLPINVNAGAVEQIIGSDPPRFTGFPAIGTPWNPGGLAPSDPFAGGDSTLFIAANGTLCIIDIRGITSSPIRPYPGYTGSLNFAVGNSMNTSGARAPFVFTAPAGASNFQLAAFLLGPPMSPLGEFGNVAGGMEFGTRIELGNLWGTTTPEMLFMTGPGGPGALHIADANRDDLISVHPNGENYRGGFHGVAGDFNGNGFQEFAVTMNDGRVAMFEFVNGNLQTFGTGFPFGPEYSGELFPAALDINNDGYDEFIVAAAKGQFPIRIFNYRNAITVPTVMAEFSAVEAGRAITGIAAGVVDEAPVIAVASGPQLSDAERRELRQLALFHVRQDGILSGFIGQPFGSATAITVEFLMGIE